MNDSVSEIKLIFVDTNRETVLFGVVMMSIKFRDALGTIIDIRLECDDTAAAAAVALR